MKEFISKYPKSSFLPVIGIESKDWIVYNPLSFILLDLLKPKNIAFVGLDTLAPAFTFCQHAKSLNLDYFCSIYISADMVAKIPEQIANHIALYSDYSNIIELNTNVNISEKDIDLLFIGNVLNTTICNEYLPNLIKKCNEQALTLFWRNVENDPAEYDFFEKLKSQTNFTCHFQDNKSLAIYTCNTSQDSDIFKFIESCNSPGTIVNYLDSVGAQLEVNQNNQLLKKQILHKEFEIEQAKVLLNKAEKNLLHRKKPWKYLGYKMKEISSKLNSKNYWQIKRKKKNAKYKIKYQYAIPDFNLLNSKIEKLSHLPKFSIITPTYNSNIEYLKKAISSVEKQIYKNWELIICDDGSTNKDTLAYLSTQNRENIIIIFSSQNIGIAKASNLALEKSIGEYVVFLDHDDELSLDALAELAIEINTSQADFVYSDEDKLNKKNKHCDPNFKPDFSLEMLFSQNYICHLACIKKTLLNTVGSFREGFDGSQDHDLFIRATTAAKVVKHIPKVLYHWRIIPSSTASDPKAKLYAYEAGKKAIQNYFDIKNEKASVTLGDTYGTYRVNRAIIDNPLVSIIIPFKDEPEILDRCLKSIYEKTKYKNFEILAISNNSLKQDAKNIVLSYKSKYQNIKYLEYNIPFNYSAINNFAFTFAKGEHILLLNNDIEIISDDWLESLLQYSQLSHIGAVGAKLLYPDNTIQHAGIIIGLGGIAGHAHRFSNSTDTGYLGRLSINQNFSAVTAACLMVKRSIYEEMKGLDDVNFKVAFNDVDFCLRILEAGYQNIYTPYCLAYHYESLSRGHENTPEKQSRFIVECNRFEKKHCNILKFGDSYYNPNLSLIFDDFSVK